MTIQQLSVFVENKKGGMAEIREILKNREINIRALSIADTTDYGVLRLIVDNPEAAVEGLKDGGITVTVTDVIAVELPDRPGGLHEAVLALTRADISIEYMYAFLCQLRGRAYVVLRVGDNEKAAGVLQNAGFRQMVTSDLCET